jgi:hypothetical protein
MNARFLFWPASFVTHDDAHTPGAGDPDPMRRSLQHLALTCRGAQIWSFCSVRVQAGGQGRRGPWYR